MGAYALAVDIGGTFTDVVLHSDDGQLWVEKTLTTPNDLLDGFFRGVDLVLAKAGVAVRDVAGIVHATTTVTNALIERKGPPTALILTRGFEDVLLLRAEHRYDLYDLQLEFAEPLIPPSLTFGAAERVLADGVLQRAIDPAEIVAVCSKLKELGVVSVAICFLNSYRNPENERTARALIAATLPGLFVSLSSDVAPQIREYPRASTTAINAYTQPVAQPYLRQLAARLRDRGFAHAPSIMLSSGGVIGPEVAGRNPVRMIESGPAAGALAAAHFARQLGHDRLMSFDMGGTTAKACLIEHGVPLVSGAQEVDRRYRFKEGSGMPVLVPAIDLIEIGAGGGSIAGIDALGLLKVGPRSAGSSPGPACYGRGGSEPTVTDANLLLGLLDADRFLGGDMALDYGSAERAYAALGARLGLSALQAASGVYRIVAEAMASAARMHATDRGVDYRGLPLLAFGGAGPVHACQVAELLQGRTIIFPPEASVLSAYGTLVSPPRIDLVRSAVMRFDQIDWCEISRIFDAMIREAADALAAAGLSAQEAVHTYAADMRFSGQQTEITTRLPPDFQSRRDVAAMTQDFIIAYRTYYGMAPTHVPPEVVSWRLTVLVPRPPLPRRGPPSGAAAAPARHRPVHAWQATAVPVYARPGLVIGQTVSGPALIEERETTIAIAPGWTAAVDALGCVIATREQRHG